MAADLKNKIFPAPLSGKHEQIAITTGATSAINTGNPALAATRAQIYTNTAIRFCVDGTTPTASKGFYADIDDMIALQSIEEIAGFKAIAVTTNGVLDVSYWG